MKKLLTLFTLYLSLCAVSALAFDGQNAYGPGVHMDATGRAYTHQDRDGNQVNPQHVRPNGYGPGRDMDEYGRALQRRAQDGNDASLLFDDEDK